MESHNAKLKSNENKAHIWISIDMTKERILEHKYFSEEYILYEAIYMKFKTGNTM